MIADPVIILAAPRSFSSLTCAMLGQHPQMYGILETQVFEVDSMREWWTRYGKANHDGDGLLRSVAEIVYGGQTQWTIEWARAWLWERRDCCGTADVFNELAERLSPLRLVEKTPIEGPGEEVEQKVRRRFHRLPRARFLHLVRHPMGYCLSQLEHLQRMSESSRHPNRMARRYAWVTDTSTDPPSVDPQVLWYRVNRAITTFLVKLPAKQQLTVRGEDLVAEPDEHLRVICRWLGVRSDPKAIEEMEHPEHWPFAAPGPSNGRWGGDPKFFRDPLLRLNHAPSGPLLSKGLPWRTDGKRFSQQVCQLARQYGYS